MLDKVAVAGDITQALDRRGVWTVAITVIGGTESTSVKLQSCETADGSFTDFAELISASDASADQYKGFIVDLHGAGKFIKVVGATMATAVFGDCDYDVKKVTIKAGEIPSGADLENNKTATIDVSTYTEPVEITPTAGKDGMKKATVTLSNIPSGGGATAYAWMTDGGPVYFPISVAPIDKADYLEKCKIGGFCEPSTSVFKINSSYASNDDEYLRISDTEFSISYEDGEETTTTTLTRYALADFTLW
jgi:hypothetical protein